MGNFFYRQSSVSTADLKTNARLRNNAFVKVTGTGASLPVSADGFTETYNPNGTGRPAPILKDVKIALEGEAGSLRRAEVNFTCFDKSSFEGLEAGFLTPGAEITIEYGYVGPEIPSQGDSHDFRVYDYQFKITKENYFDCSLKAVAKGTEFDVLNINGKHSFTEPMEFVTDYGGTNETAFVENLFDYIDYAIQKATNKNNATAFDPPNGASGPLSRVGGHYGVLVAPDEYKAPTALSTGWFTDARIMYISLKAIVGIVNKFCLKENTEKYQIHFHNDYSKIVWQAPSAKIWSPSPHEMLFPHSKGSSENSYHKSKLGKSKEYISVDSFDNVGSLAGGDPGNILLSRDLMRVIQQAFDDSPKREDEMTEEELKAKGDIPLSRFFKKIFATIRENSGGAWDMYLEHKDGVDDGTIYIINKKAPPTGGVTPVWLNPTGGTNGVRSISLAGKVPKDIQAKAFGGAPDTDGKEEGATVVNEKAEKPKKKAKNMSQKSRAARGKIHSSAYSMDSISSAKGVVRDLVNERTTAQRAKAGELLDPTPYPLEVSFVTDGISGFNFGDTISSNYLPSRYTKNAGIRVVFTVIKYTHIIKSNDWSTEVKCISRIVSN